jgi:SulP family sulfate permease
MLRQHPQRACPPQDWLFIAYKRVSLVEYLLLVGTLAAIMAFGLEAGIACGIVAAAVHFAYRWVTETKP